MIKIKTPASSANIGPGFDCLGIAFDIFNTFTVEKASETVLCGLEDRFNNEDNLFLQAYRKGCEYAGDSPHIHVGFDCDIPVSRGLGSSAALIIGGLCAASMMQKDVLDMDFILSLASEMEGHPDNAAAALYGGLCGAVKMHGGAVLNRRIDLDEDWKYTLLIPDFEISTAAARAVLPDTYTRRTAWTNSANAIMTVEALRNGDDELLRTCARDAFHEPYRRKLIAGYSQLKEIVEKDSSGAMVISGSGPTCLLISRRPLSADAAKAVSLLPEGNWQIREVSPALNGTVVTVEENS